MLAERTDASIRAGLARLLADPPDRPATRRYAERYDWSETGRQHRALLEAAVARRHSRDGGNP